MFPSKKMDIVRWIIKGDENEVGGMCRSSRRMRKAQEEIPEYIYHQDYSSHDSQVMDHMD